MTESRCDHLSISKETFELGRDSNAVGILRQGFVKNVDYINEKISFDEFYSKYLLPNRPCILSSEATSSWSCFKDWVDSEGNPDLTYLSTHYGEAIVPVARCNQREYDSQPKTEMSLKQFLEYWRQRIGKDVDSGEDVLYCKDWHFTRVFADAHVYSTPFYFENDFLNEYFTEKANDDYRFVYMGPKDSWTPLHADVLRSYSWSTNVCGRKKWFIFPPGEEEKLKDSKGNMAFDVRDLEMSGVIYFKIVQEAGETIFIPSGWYHQVINMADTISINHNWFNSSSIDLIWNFLLLSLNLIEESIDDCRDMDNWYEHCQLMLRAQTGFSFADFYELLYMVGKNRLKRLTEMKSMEKECGEDSPCCKQKLLLLLLDLYAIYHVIAPMSRNVKFLSSTDFDTLPERPKKFLKEIEETMVAWDSTI